MRIGALFVLALFAAGCASALGDGTALSARSPTLAAAQRPDPLPPGHVERTPLDFEKGSAHYVGGIARAQLPASKDAVLAALDDVPSLARLLPKTKSAKLVSATPGSRKVELVQGNSIVTARYTVELVPSATPGELTFRLDRSRPHDIEDVYGYFRVEAADDHRSVVTVAAAVSIGSGFMDLLFGKRVQDVILSAPVVMRDYFANKEAPGRALVAKNEAP